MSENKKTFVGGGKKSGFSTNIELDFGQLMAHLVESDEAVKQKAALCFKTLLELAENKDGFYVGESQKTGKKLLKIKLSISENKDKQYNDYSVTLNTWKKPENDTKTIIKTGGFEVEDIPENAITEEEEDLPF
jgi:hypothetical protein